MDEEEEAQRLLLELAAAAEHASASLRELNRVLRRVESVALLRTLEAPETMRSLSGGETREREMADAAIARARGPRR